MQLKKGEKSSISVTFNTRGKKGRQGKSVTVTTNDPTQNTIMLRVTGEVEVPATTTAPTKTTTSPVKKSVGAPTKLNKSPVEKH